MSSRKLRAIIVDDESLARRYIRRLLHGDEDIEIVAECASGAEALEAIAEHEPDLMFLDIQMPEMDGFAVLESIMPEMMPEVIFVTAFDQFALRAFEVHALDYLLKPFDRPRFEKSLGRAKVSLRNPDHDRAKITNLVDHMKSRPGRMDRLMVKVDGRVLILKSAEIDWIEAEDKYVRIHTGKKTFLVRLTMNAVERRLDPSHFVRIHRSAIINIDRIVEMHPLFNGEQAVILDSGAKLTLSRRYKAELYRLLGDPS